MKQMSGLDAFFLYGETHTQAMNLTGVGIYEGGARPGGRLEFAEVLQYARQRTARSAHFRRKIVEVPFNADFPYWTEDAQFDVRNHVFHTALPKPGNQTQLDEAVARIHASLIERTHPLWQWWIIDGLDAIEGVPSGSFAVAFKLHHAAFDGKSGWEVIAVSHDSSEAQFSAESDTPQPAADTALPLTVPPGATAMMTRAWLRSLTAPMRFAKTALASVPMMKQLAKQPARDFPIFAGKVPRTQFNAALGQGRVHASVLLDIPWLKAARSLVEGSTINDVVLTVIGGALREYLEYHGTLPDESLVVGMPVSIRPDNRKHSGGNEAILAVLPFGSDLPDVVERLRHVHTASRRKKEYVQAMPAHRLIEYADFIPGNLSIVGVQAFTWLKFADYVPPTFNTIVTNVPASRVPLYFAGAKMVRYDACGPIWTGAGIIHVITSYLGDVRISFDAAANVLPDPNYYRSCLLRSVAAVDRAMVSSPSVAMKPKRTRKAPRRPPP